MNTVVVYWTIHLILLFFFCVAVAMLEKHSSEEDV